MFVTCKHLGNLGRLGNQLFQIAAVIGVARKNRCVFAFPFWTYATCFQNLIPQSNKLPNTQPYVDQAYSFQDIRITEPTHLVGFFQSEKYFKHCDNEVRHYFTPMPASVASLSSTYGSVLAKKTCSVHVRRGDYVGSQKFADLTLGDYYPQALACFDSDTTFLFFSDDIAWCKAHFRDPRFVFVEGNQEIEDLFLMSLCQGHIIANSSFSWWAAWLDGRQEKVVVAPSRWFIGPDGDPNVPYQPWPVLYGYHDTKDAIPAGWLVL